MRVLAIAIVLMLTGCSVQGEGDRGAHEAKFRQMADVTQKGLVANYLIVAGADSSVVSQPGPRQDRMLIAVGDIKRLCTEIMTLDQAGRYKPAHDEVKVGCRDMVQAMDDIEDAYAEKDVTKATRAGEDFNTAAIQLNKAWDMTDSIAQSIGEKQP